jgi:hypothetical protein
MAEQLSGGCQCGRVRFTASVDRDRAYPCHCRMCQRATGGVYAAMVGTKRDNVIFAGEPGWYRSSAIAERAFCPDCGTPIGFRYLDSPNIDLTVGSFDDPSAFRPTNQFGYESSLPAWQNLSAVPHMNSDDYEPLQQKWRDSGSGPPT